MDEIVTRLRGRILRAIFGISQEEVTFGRRGFREGETKTRQRLEQIGTIFLQGYHAVLENDDPSFLSVKLNRIEPELCGFAFEGAAMSLALLDIFTPWKKNRWSTFVQDFGDSHVYMVHIGLGWALARLRRKVGRPLSRLDPLLRWLVVDGYGFHEGYFHWGRYFPRCTRMAARLGVRGYAFRAFDQGLGRSLWFVEGANAGRIPKVISAFPASRHADLWSGVGLACAYAGCIDSDSTRTLQKAAGPFRPQLAQGATFAAKARQRAGNPAEHTEQICRILCGLSAEEAARVTDSALEGLPPDGDEPAYEEWRRRIQNFFSQ